MARVSSQIKQAGAELRGKGMLGFIGDAISLRSFASLWYWLAWVVFWIWALGQAIGLPLGIVARARRSADALARLEVMAQMMAQHRVQMWRAGQVLWVALAATLLGLLTALAFFYGVELAQAVWFIATPLLLIWAGNLRAAVLIARGNAQGAALLKVIFYLQIYAQVIAFVFILLTITFAFFQMLLTGQLG